MDDHILDIIEQGELKCEDWASENVYWEKFRCSCGKMCNLVDGMTMTPDPYAIPICSMCFETAFENQKEKRDGV